MGAPNTVILNFSPGVVTNGEPLGKKLFAVCFFATDQAKAPTSKTWVALYRGGSLNAVRKIAMEDADTLDKSEGHKVLDLVTSVEHILEIGVLR